MKRKWKILIADRKGRLIGYKLINAKTAHDATKPTNVGSGRMIIGVIPSRHKLSKLIK